MTTRQPVDERGFRWSRVALKGLVAVLGVWVAFSPEHALAKGRGRARAKPATRVDKHACVESYNKAKESVQSGRLLDAKEPLGRCARATCGRFLQKECTTLYLQMDADIPSVVPIVSDATDAAGAAFEVKMDGELLTSKLDGIAIPINPGWHEFTFGAEGTVFATQKVLVAQGQRNRAISVSQRGSGAEKATASETIPTKSRRPRNVAVEETAPHVEKAARAEAAEPAEAVETRSSRRKVQAPEVRPEQGVSWPTYALAGVGVVGLGGAGLLAYWGRQDNTALQDACKPNCNPDSVHHIRMLYLASDISAGIGVAALIASTWLYLRSGSSEEKASTETARLRRLDLRPSASGAYATVSGTF